MSRDSSIQYAALATSYEKNNFQKTGHISPVLLIICRYEHVSRCCIHRW